MLIVTENNSIVSSILFRANNEAELIEKGKYSEKYINDVIDELFVAQCRGWNPTISDEDIDEALENGYYEFAPCTLQVHYPTEVIS